MSKKQINFFTLLILSLIIMFINIGGLSIYALDEAKNAVAAREMWESGNWIVPTFNYELRFDKPPLHYFFMMLAYELFGYGEFAARFFASLAGVSTIMMTYLFARKYFDESVAYYTGFVLVCSLHLALQFHMAVPDPFLIFFLTAASLSFYTGITDKKRRWIFICYLALGLAVLSKGPVGIALPGLSFLLYLLWTKQFTWSNIKWLQPWTGLLIVLLVAGPWYIAVYQATDGLWIEEFFFKHNVSRFSAPMEGHGGLFLITWAFVLGGMLPYGVFIPQAFIIAWKGRNNHALLFSLISAAVIILFFSISSTKLPNYTVPSYPFLAILLGYFINKIAALNWVKRTSYLISLSVFLIICLAFPIGIYLAFTEDDSLRDLAYVGWYMIPVSILGLVTFYLGFKKRYEAAIRYQGATFFVASIIFFQLAFATVDPKNPVTESLQTLDMSKEFGYYRSYNSAYSFYLSKPIQVLNKEEVASFFLENPDGYLLTRNKYFKDLAEIPGLKIIYAGKDLFESNISIVVIKE